MTNQPTIRRGMPVLVLPDGDYLKHATTDVAALDPFDVGGVLTTRLESTWRHIPVAHLRPHPLAAEVAALEEPKVQELDFPCPPCARCDIETYHDGDGFCCTYCLARWSDNGTGGILPCVEDASHEATVTGKDGQPRCTLCELRVRTGEIEEPSGPYQCQRCKQDVVGIGVDFGTPASENRHCAYCQQAAEHRKFVDDLIERRKNAA
jgi:hypothetical protein